MEFLEQRALPVEKIYRVKLENTKSVLAANRVLRLTHSPKGHEHPAVTLNFPARLITDIYPLMAPQTPRGKGCV